MSNSALHGSKKYYHPSPHLPKNHQYQVLALVLQGGGALGAYQPGVYQGLAEFDLHPNWVSGISIGALNAAIIAGNPVERRVDQLQAFWDYICQPPILPKTPFPDNLFSIAPSWFLQGFAAWEASRALVEGQHGFFTPRLPWEMNSGNIADLSFYNTQELKRTLERFVDFDRINHPKTNMRVTVGAVNIRNGDFVYFDNTKQTLTPEHFMASGALPPGFPPVEIDGEFYWDGGLVSNTPLQNVVSEEPRKNTLVFQVDLWSAKGDLPKDMMQLNMRHKDILYSSRTRAITNAMAAEQRHRSLLRDLKELIPEEHHQHPAYKKLSQLACHRVLNIIHLIYQNKDYESAHKDFQFNHLSMREHWNSGYQDIMNSLKNKHWLDMPSLDNPFVTHDLHRLKKNPKTV